jgi:ribosome maturation factor RimP
MEKVHSTLDQVTVASKLVSELLDEAAFMGETPFTLEVTSPGIDRPLTLPRHFAKNHDRLLKVTKSEMATWSLAEFSRIPIAL